MIHRLVFFTFLSFFVPSLVMAQDAPVTRRDGFLMIWNSIERKVLDSNEKPFLDVTEGSQGYEEIRYAKYRGILDDDLATFFPDQPLQLQDALLWLFRTRSVDDIDLMNAEHLPDLLSRYPIGDFIIPGPAAEPPRVKDENISRDALLDLIIKFDTLLKDEVHEASLYAEKFHGKGTAFGEPFDMHALTAAHRTFPHNTLVRVTNVENDKSVTVRINDRGPYVHGRDMDLSLAAFTTIAERSKGKINVRFERLGDQELVGPCREKEARYQTRLSRDVRFVRGIPHELNLGDTLILSANKPFAVRGVVYPDGTAAKIQDFVHPEERYEFRPSVTGEYVFRFSLVNGRKRIMRMNVTECDQVAPEL